MEKPTSTVYKSSEEITIESKKSGAASINKSSEEYYEYNCDPCKGVGDFAEAEGFCNDCREYLCITCFRSHSRNRESKHHVLLCKDDMPVKSRNMVLPKKTRKYCSPCRMVGDQIYAYGWCEDCSDLLCSECFESHHRNKLSGHHVLVIDRSVSSSIADMNINKGDQITNEEFKFVRDVNVKSGSDEKDCHISRITVVSSNELVLCDYNNKCLKLVDVSNDRIKDVLALQSEPNGMSAISDDQVAVVLENMCEIQIVTTCGKLTLGSKIKTSGKCVDVKMMNKLLYVSYLNPVKFQILRPTGAIIKTIKPDDEVLNHCTLPCNIALSLDESVIYVSDWNTNKVLSLDMNGTMIALYEGELDKPKGIIISPTGSVYICNRDQHVVYKTKSDLSETTVILGLGDGLNSPDAICFNTDNQHLYISSGSGYAKYCNVLKVFKC